MSIRGVKEESAVLSTHGDFAFAESQGRKRNLGGEASIPSFGIGRILKRLHFGHIHVMIFFELTIANFGPFSEKNNDGFSGKRDS